MCHNLLCPAIIICSHVVLSLREEAEDGKEAQGTAPPCSVCADGASRRFPEVQNQPQPSRQPSQREKTAAHRPASKQEHITTVASKMNLH